MKLFSKLLHGRLSLACPIHEQQRGFRKSPGCSENLHILQSIIDSYWAGRKPLAVVLVDVAKAFDTVTHEHATAERPRRAHHKPDQELLSGRSHKRVRSDPIEMEVGVRQGCPLSPLFNLAIDMLLHT